MIILILKKECVGSIAELEKENKINHLEGVFKKEFLKGRGTALEKTVSSSIDLCI